MIFPDGLLVLLLTQEKYFKKSIFEENVQDGQLCQSSTFSKRGDISMYLQV